MSKKTRSLSPPAIAVLSALEYVVAVAVVVAAIGALTDAARRVDASPLTVDTERVTLLSPWDAELSGDIALGPTTLEEKSGEFDYHFGRKLLTERKRRDVRTWRSGGAMSWRVRIPAAGSYQLESLYAAPTPDSGGRYKLTVEGDGDTYRSETLDVVTTAPDVAAAIRPIGAPLEFTKADTATIQLVAADVPGATLMRLQQIALCPAGTTSAPKVVGGEE